MTTGLEASFVNRLSGGPEVRVEGLQTPEPARITVLFGASGAGKTTTLRCLAGLERPDEGRIQLGDTTWVDVQRGVFLPARKRNVGFVPQDYALFPHLTVERNISYGLRELPASSRQGRVAEALDWVRLRGFEERMPQQLSGGEKQRVALARAVVRHPGLLLLDEPFSSVDLPSRQRLRTQLRALLLRLKIPTILVTHDRTEALAMGDWVAVMDAGRIVQQGTVHEVFSRPANLAVAGIVAMETVQPGRVIAVEDLVTVQLNGVRLKALRGDLPSETLDVYVCIRAEDVILMKEEPIRSSPRNCLAARVEGLSPEGPMRRVDLDCGFPLMALLTKQACEEMSLQPGSRVVALVKAPQIHLIPR